MKPKEHSQFESIVEKHGLTSMDFLITVENRKPRQGKVIPLFGYWPEVRVESIYTGLGQTYNADPQARWLEEFERDLNSGRF